MVKRTPAIFAALFFAICGAVSAQDYRFSVDENRSDIFIRTDGGIDIEYVLTFTCGQGAQPVDVVDVGLPNDYYQLSTVRSWIDGQQLTDIRKSSYIPVGVEVHLGSYEIKPGRSGTLQVTATNPHMVFPDSKDSEYASVEFYPVYYDGKYTTGRTRLQVAIHFPEGADGEKVKWHYQEYNEWARDEAGRLTYIWRDDQASPSSRYRFGVGFPKNLVHKVFEPVSTSHYSSHGAGERIANWLLKIFFAFPPAILIAIVVILVALFNSWIRKRRLMKYFPPVTAVESSEIKRGLTAPEAAMLLEVPLTRVLAMIIFGMVKKGMIRVEPSTKLKLEVLRFKAEDMRFYERDFLEVINSDGYLDDKDLRKYFVKTVKRVHEKVKGFNVRKTREYYQNILSLAWSRVEKSASVGVLSRNLDEQFGWLMMDPKMDGRLKDVVGEREVAPPMWWWGYHPTSTWSRPSTPGESVWVSGVDFADAVASRIEGLADSAVSHFDSLASGVTRSTNPPPVRTYSSGGGGGGCACACAGCACACAGGGR